MSYLTNGQICPFIFDDTIQRKLVDRCTSAGGGTISALGKVLLLDGVNEVRSFQCIPQVHIIVFVERVQIGPKSSRKEELKRTELLANGRTFP